MSGQSAEKAERHVMHDYPKRGARTSCCDRDRNDLPFAEGMTTRAADVTCDGTYTPAVLAHEVYPHPSDRHDQPPTLADAAKYHAARALALYNDDIDHPGYMDQRVGRGASSHQALPAARARRRQSARTGGPIMTYAEPCDDCTTCLCGRTWCRAWETSPGEALGICSDCYVLIEVCS